MAGKVPVKRNRFVTLSGGDKTVNRDLETKARSLAGIKGYVTNLPDPTADTVIGAYHQLWQVENSFRMSKHDLQARQIYHRQRDSIEAHLNIVFAALAASRWTRTTPAGASNVSSGPRGATAPSRSRSASRPSPPPTRYPPTSTRP